MFYINPFFPKWSTFQRWTIRVPIRQLSARVSALAALRVSSASPSSLSPPLRWQVGETTHLLPLHLLPHQLGRKSRPMLLGPLRTPLFTTPSFWKSLKAPRLSSCDWMTIPLLVPVCDSSIHSTGNSLVSLLPLSRWSYLYWRNGLILVRFPYQTSPMVCSWFGVIHTMLNREFLWRALGRLTALFFNYRHGNLSLSLCSLNLPLLQYGFSCIIYLLISGKQRRWNRSQLILVACSRWMISPRL